MLNTHISPHPFITIQIYNGLFFFNIWSYTVHTLIRGPWAPNNEVQLKRLLPDGSAGALVVNKALSLNFHFSFINRISLLLNQLATLLSSRSWVEPVPDPILPEKHLGYSRGSNPGPLGWQSDVLTTIPKARSYSLFTFLYLALLHFNCGFHYSRIIFAVHYSCTKLY